MNHPHHHTSGQHGQGDVDHHVHGDMGHDHHHGDHGGHGDHGDHGAHVAQYRTLFWWMLALSIPVVFLSHGFAHLIGYELPDFPGIGWVAPVLGTVIFVVGGRPFLSGAVTELRNRQPGMMMLIALAITVAFLASLGASLGVLDAGLDFWWELALLVVIMLLGHWMEMRALAQTSSALDSLAELLPDQAERIDPDGQVEAVAPARLRAGDLVIVRPGASVPADGQIESGSAALNEALLTGESRPVPKGPGDPVVAGSVVTDTGLRVRITATGDDTTLAGIQRMVAEAQSSSTRTQRLADRVAGWLFWYASGAAVITAVVWLIVGAPEQALARAITVLVIACPHALGLAIPLVVSIATGRAARRGVLITNRLALETARQLSVVYFDKTGTLTRGEPELLDVTATGTTSGEEVLALAAAAEHDSEHPLAQAIVAGAHHHGLTVPRASDFTSRAALGVRATVDGRSVAVGGPLMIAELGLDTHPGAEAMEARGATVLHVVTDGRVIGVLALGDAVREESREAVDDLHAAGISVGMITGDAPGVAARVADELGIDEVHAGVRPEGKEGIIADKQDAGDTVAMVGDGVNDAPALARADLGVAIGAGTDVAAASADVVLASDDPRALSFLVGLSRAAYRLMSQNLWWAAGYNLLSVPLAAGVLAPVGFILPMSVGAVLMSLSTIIVALNAQRLRTMDLGENG